MALLSLIVPALVVPEISVAQERELTTGYVVERRVQDRWLHGRQQPGFTPYAESRDWIHIDSVEAGPSEKRRTLNLTVGRPEWGDPGSVTVDSVGRVLGVQARLRPRPRSEVGLPEDMARARRWRYFEGRPGRRLALPGARIRGLIPTFAPPLREVGQQWTDTLSWTDERGGFRQSLRGRRVSTIVGDTLIDGRRLWIVRDSATVRYEERWLTRERTLDTLVVVEREGTGVVRGRHLYDPETRLYRSRHDTTRLTGTATLGHPDGRSFTTPARYERARTFHVHTPPEYLSRRDELLEARRAGRGGMLRLPGNELERRLRAGDAEARDSLLGAWRDADDPEERLQILRLLGSGGDRGSSFGRRVLEVRLEAGDTAGVVESLLRGPMGHREPMGVETLQFLRPFMADPGLAFAFGLDRDPLYEGPREGLLRRPPAITPDTAEWPCTPEACEFLARQWQTDSEPRLRDMGLVARVAMDPARWADAVFARVEEGSAYLEPAAELLRGVGSTAPAAAKAPLPDPDAGWRAWAHWLSGRDPRYRVPATSGPRPLLRFGSMQGVAIRLYEARTDRDVVAELKQRARAAASDSARVVYDYILLEMGEHDPDPDSVARRIRFGTELERSLALRELRHLFRREGAPADSTTTVALTNRLLAAMIGDGEPWPLLDPERGGEGTGLGRHGGSRYRPIFILREALPPALHDRWREQATLLSTEEWQARDDRRAGILYTPSTVARVGPFVRLGVDAEARAARATDEAPRGHAFGVEVYLMETDEGWRIVTSGQWAT